MTRGNNSVETLFLGNFKYDEFRNSAGREPGENREEREMMGWEAKGKPRPKPLFLDRREIEAAHSTEPSSRVQAGG